MKKPTSSKSAPSGPSTASSGGGSTRDRNTRGAARDDSSRRAAATGGEDSDESGGIGAGGAGQASDAGQGEDTIGFDPKAKQSKAQEYTVLEGGTIDDGKGGKFKVCKPGDTVMLSPERAEHFRKHGVPLESSDEKREREKNEKRKRAEEVV
jgi:hypothetical protein